jgi:hypothetical protein
VQNMTFAATDDHTQSPFDIAAYPTPPNILEFPNSQSANNRIGGSTNSVWDRGSADRPCSAFVWIKLTATPSVNFPVVLSMGDNTTGGFAIYYNNTNQRIESSHRNGATVTGGSSVWTMPSATWVLAGWRYNPTDGWQINTQGVDRSTRINPAKWANSVIPAQFRPGTWGVNTHWEGDMADAAFFNYELTADNMLDVYTAGTTTPSGGSTGVGQWWIAVDGEWVQQ